MNFSLELISQITFTSDMRKVSLVKIRGRMVSVLTSMMTELLFGVSIISSKQLAVIENVYMSPLPKPRFEKSTIKLLYQ